MASLGSLRFHDLYDPTESIEAYRPGGYHPVHIRDSFKNRRYTVLRKLGYGSFSTLWLVRDSEQDRYVALKVGTADALRHGAEIAIHDRLKQHHKYEAGKTHIMTLLDHFDHTGPNGTHECLVFEVMGPNAETMVEELPENQPLRIHQVARYQLWMAKSILYQALLGLHYLHTIIGVAHGDIQPGNLLFSLRDLSLADEASLQQMEEEGQTSDPISDLGAAFFEDKPPPKLATPVALRSPEMILGCGQPRRAQDLWSLGCLVFEFVTGAHLFSVSAIGDDTPDDTDDQHLLQMIDVLGPLPHDLADAWPRYSTYFNDKGEQIEEYVGKAIDCEAPAAIPAPWDIENVNASDGLKEDVDKMGLDEKLRHELSSSSSSSFKPIFNTGNSDSFDPHFPTLEKHFAQERPPSLTATEAQSTLALVRSMLDYNPANRPTTSQLLAHPWFVRSRPTTRSCTQFPFKHGSRNR